MIVLAVISIINILISKRKTSAVLNYLLKALSLLIIAYLTILEMPIFQLFVTPILCSSESLYNPTRQCFQGSHSIYFGIGLAFIVIHIFILVVLVTLYADINPCSMIPFAGPQSKISIAKSSYKMVVVLFYNLDYRGDYVSYFIGFCTVFSLLLLTYRYRRIVYYKRGVNTFSAICDSALAWAYVCVIIHIIFTDGSSRIGLIYMAILCPFACIAYVFIIEKRSFHVLKANVKGLKKDDDVEIFVNVILGLVEKSEVDSNRIKLEGMLRNYQKNSAVDSPDEAIVKELTDDGTIMDDNKDKLGAWYRLIKSIVEQSLKKFGKSPKLRLLLAYIQHEKIKNKFKSLFELMQAADMKPNYLEEFSIYRYKLIIEEEMIEMDMRHNNDMNGMDVNQMVLFQNNYVKFTGTIEKAVKLHHEFWKELLEESPDIKKLEGLGSSITRIVEVSKKQYDALNDLNPNHQKCLEMYGRFLKDVVNDDTSGQRILERADKVSRQLSQRQAGDDLAKIDENSETAIITISGNFRQIGVITNSNNQISQLLGYNKSEVIGEKIETIMPKIFADNHDELLLKYFDNPNQQLNIERTVYPMNKRGYIAPFNLTAKILPNLDNGIQIVGFLRLISGFDPDKDKYLLYSPETGMVYGVSKACYTYFGVRSSLTFGKCYNMSELNFDQLSPEILEESKQQLLKSSNGLTVVLDTSSIQANHPLENEDDESQTDEKVDVKEEEEVRAGEQRTKRYKKYNVKARIIEDKRWFDGKLRVAVLKLWEANRDHESQEADSEHEEKQVMPGEIQRHLENVAEEPEQIAEVGGNESLNDIGSSQLSNAEGADIKTVKDTRALIAEKNVPRTIKNLNRIFYLFILFLLVIFALLIFFCSVNKSTMNEINTALKVTHARHSILAEINYFVRKLHSIGINLLDYGTTRDAEIAAVKATINTKSNALQQIQFQIGESIRTMNDNLGKDVSINNINNYAETNPGQIDVITSGYESTLFQYTAETFQVNNATMDDINQSFLATSLNDTTRNIRKAFSGIFYNGLRDLRSASLRIASDVFDVYTKEISRSFNIYIVLVCCIGMGLVLIGNGLLIPTVFKVMRTTRLVITLFGMIENADIIALSDRCERFSLEYLVEGEKKNDHEEKQKSSGTDNPVPTETVVIKSEAQGQGAQLGSLAPTKKDNEEEPFDVKTEKLPTLNQNQVHIVPEGDKKKEKDNKDGASEQIKNKLLSNLEQVEDERSYLKDNKKGSPIKNDKNSSKTKDKNGKNKTKKELEDKKKQYNDDEESMPQKLMNSKEGVNTQIIILFGLCALFMIAPFVALTAFESAMVKQKVMVLTHYKSLAVLPSEIKYSLVFAIESLANVSRVKLIPDRPSDNAAEYYNKQTYDTFTDTALLLEETVPAAYNDYVSLYKSVVYQNACSSVLSLNNSTSFLTLDACNSNNFMSTGVYTSATQILTRSNQVFQQVEDMINDNTASESSKKAIMNDLLGLSSSIEYLMTSNGVALDFLIQSFYDKTTQYNNYVFTIDLVIIILGIVVLFVMCLFVWRPYIENLNNNIWRTKGMLSMIPMQVILENEGLKQAMTSGQLMQAVK